MTYSKSKLALFITAASLPSLTFAKDGHYHAHHHTHGHSHNKPTQEDTHHHLEEVIVQGRHTSLVGLAKSASEGVVGQTDLELRPILRPGDILEAIPGMIVTQHSGSGKSNQMFLRGFNLDHGTDFSTSIDGMPVNMRTHGHGQGYTDVNFLIPETVETLSFVKGPYHADLGDFSSAGGTQLSTFDAMEHSSIKLGLGENGYQRLLAIGSANIDDTHFYGALEAQVYSGPWSDVDEDLDKLNLLAKFYKGDEDKHWSVTAMHYDNHWNSADQIPARAVSQGIIDKFGSLDTTLGGNSKRSSLSAHFQNHQGTSGYSFDAYAINYNMQLWSNFTYLLDNPDTSDQFEQFDKRTILGGSGQYQWQAGNEQQFKQRVGFELRHDDISKVGLYNTYARQRLDTVREDAVEETSFGAFYELEWSFAENWRSVFGVRADHFSFDVDAGNEVNSGSQSDNLASPKISLIYAISGKTEAYFSAGQGFHSNDARGTTITQDPASGEVATQVDPLVKSQGSEIGFKTAWRDGWNSSIALWQLSLDSELLFVGDAGNTEASSPSERRGVELNNHWSLDDTWAIEADFAWTDAELKDTVPGENELPGAIPFVVSGAVSADYDNGWFGSFRMRHFSSYPLIEDNSQKSDGSATASLALGWHNNQWKLQLDALNIFDSNDHDIDYYYASRMTGEPEEGIEDNHYKVMEPRQLRLYVEYLW